MTGKAAELALAGTRQVSDPPDKHIEHTPSEGVLGFVGQPMRPGQAVLIPSYMREPAIDSRQRELDREARAAR